MVAIVVLFLLFATASIERDVYGKMRSGLIGKSHVKRASQPQRPTGEAIVQGRFLKEKPGISHSKQTDVVKKNKLGQKESRLLA